MVMIDMDKPLDCTGCPMCSCEDDSCLLQIKMYDSWEEQYDNCPITEAVAEEIDKMIKEEDKMTDLISRADAIEAVKETKPIVRSTERNWGKMIAEQHSKELVKALKALPSAVCDECIWHACNYNKIDWDALSAEAEWIPCSERLPIPPTFCLVTTDGSHGDVIDIALYMSDGWHKASEVFAWMPLPTPYKGGDDE